MLSKVFGKILVLFGLFQILGNLGLVMAKYKEVNIAFTYTLVNHHILIKPLIKFA
jgi:hypothetical protein